MKVDSTRKTARLAGLLYLLSSIPGFFALLYVPTKLIVRGDAAATAERLRSSGAFFRLGIGAELLGMTLFIFVALVLYRLFQPVSPGPALSMMVLMLMSIPITLLGVVSEIAALKLAGGATGVNYLSVLDDRGRDALAYLFLQLHGQGILVAQIFWGLWLFPFGVCVIRSGFIPRFLGVFLMIAAFGYLGSSTAELVFPQVAQAADRVTSILNLFELPIIFWLLIWGAKPQKVRSAASPE